MENLRYLQSNVAETKKSAASVEKWSAFGLLNMRAGGFPRTAKFHFHLTHLGRCVSVAAHILPVPPCWTICQQTGSALARLVEHSTNPDKIRKQKLMRPGPWQAEGAVTGMPSPPLLVCSSDSASP